MNRISKEKWPRKNNSRHGAGKSGDTLFNFSYILQTNTRLRLRSCVPLFGCVAQ